MKIILRVFSFLILLLCISCSGDDTLFSSIGKEDSGITFNNIVEYNDSLNILKYEYIYNGGGVVIADFNQDSLQDILFTGNIVDNALYINKGDLQFEDVSHTSGIAPSNRWSTGATLTDINADGLLDIFITASGHSGIPNRSNQLLICTHIDDHGIPIFQDLTEAYGLQDSSYSQHAAFIDYDNDLDLDLFIINNHMVEDRMPSKYKDRRNDVVTVRTDRLYRNDWNEKSGHPVFVDVSESAGILKEGFSLALNIHDFNQDGWDDIYITNDYLTNDLLYINQKDGTFKDEADKYFKHTSYSAMGNDVVDLDNDGFSEVVALDMLPNDNYRKKTMLPSNNYTAYINNERYGYQHQQVRNTLQKNNFNKDKAGNGPIFSEQALLSGVAATDWSWAPLIADYDNDGDRDIIVTNGFPQDITDRDFIDYNQNVGAYASDEYLLSTVPSIKILNVAFENQGNLSFDNVTKKWGINEPSFSNGAAYGDLDNDGDLDYVVNNINDVASLYRNNTDGMAHWVRIRLQGPDKNPLALGSKISLFTGGEMQKADYTTVHGYLSSVEPIAHFGLGKITNIDSLIIEWPGMSKSTFYNLPVNQEFSYNYNDIDRIANNPRFNDIEYLLADKTLERKVDYVHKDLDYNDFSVQPMLLHKLSQYGPGIAVGDVNGDQLEDFYLSGSHFNSGIFYLQSNIGTYQAEQLINDTLGKAPGEELGALLFDADSDGDNDLYVVHGGNEYRMTDSIYQDRFYKNDKGRFNYQAQSLPSMLSSGSVVRAADMDADGDLDLFVGGRVNPQDYPNPGRSFLLRNDSKEGSIHFTDVTSVMAPFLSEIGMVTDALWTDHNNDGQMDLILTGEFMPVTIITHQGDHFTNQTAISGLASYLGWWNSIVGTDFDNDGDIDYVAGNYGNHSLTEISDKHPIKLYYKDFDDNGTKDLIPTCWFEDQTGKKSEYPYFGRLEYQKQINKIKAEYRKHGEFAKATIHELFDKEALSDCLILSANYMSSSYIKNNGNGTFEIFPLPAEVQIAPIFGMEILDINQDGYDDLLMIGNDYGMEVSIGRMDAHDGLVLLGNGTGAFEVITSNVSGFYVQGNGKSMATVYNKIHQSQDIITAENQGPVRIYNTLKADKVFRMNDNDSFALIHFENGVIRKLENYIGSSFLSQSSRFKVIPPQAVKIEIINNKGEIKLVALD